MFCLGALQQKLVKQLEMLQQQALRYIFNNYIFMSNVSAMLCKLNLLTIINLLSAE